MGRTCWAAKDSALEARALALALAGLLLGLLPTLLAGRLPCMLLLLGGLLASSLCAAGVACHTHSAWPSGALRAGLHASWSCSVKVCCRLAGRLPGTLLLLGGLLAVLPLRSTITA